MQKVEWVFGPADAERFRQLVTGIRDRQCLVQWLADSPKALQPGSFQLTLSAQRRGGNTQEARCSFEGVPVVLHPMRGNDAGRFAKIFDEDLYITPTGGVIDETLMVVRTGADTSPSVPFLRVEGIRSSTPLPPSLLRGLGAIVLSSQSPPAAETS